ncbi:FAD-dependent oxidoreductase [Nocardiopsis sp. NPDC050513]|uniref:FAD-dependent oxidoreductase n=1 Tax=Nocardiopsis sp. NPDC050513 TaxID=3364338 RepID=UPI00379BC5B2
MSAPAGGSARPFDVAVVGAGPAGLSAATTAADHGRSVIVVDAADQIGGQYWRHPHERWPRGEESAGHHDWRRFSDLRERFRAHLDRGRITHLASTQVWFVERGPATGDDRSRVLHLAPTTAVSDAGPGAVAARAVILCPGGYDRQLPVPGWDLPGVMAAGGVQALLKGHRTLAGDRVVVAGTGPFLLPVARQLAEAGARVVAVCEANGVTGWARHPTAVLDAPSKILEAAGYAAALARHRIPYRTRTTVSRIDPDAANERAGRVRLARLDGQGRIVREGATLEVDLVALGWGFTPSLELVTAAGAQTRIDVDRSLVAVVDAHQRSTSAGVYVAGEATGVGGALLAVAEGELAGAVAAGDMGAPVGERRVRSLQQRIRRLRRFATAMHLAHPVPRHWPEWLTDDTTVCRCEEVDYGAVRRARDELHAADLRTVKLLARPGMGWCQGRVCGFATACLAAAQEDRELSADDLRPVARQPLCAPVSLERLAGDAADSDG